MKKKAKIAAVGNSEVHAVPATLPDGSIEYNLRAEGKNGAVLFNDRQGRPRKNVRRDLKRIIKALTGATLIFDPLPEPGNAVISPDTDPLYPA